MSLSQTARNRHDASNGAAQPGAGDLEIVVVGGVDPGGGAGVLRDVATAMALRARARVVGTAWTEQGPGVHEVQPRDPAAVGRGLALALTGGARAVKIGMAVGPATATAILDALAGYRGGVVVDPVLASSRGGALWGAAPAEILALARRADLVTPNAIEAAALAGLPAVRTVEEAEAVGRRLVAEAGLRAVLVKGGHLDDDATDVTDVLATASGSRHFRRARAGGPTPRGTGCALATAIAVGLARGEGLETSVDAATAWLGAAIRAATTFRDERRL